MKRALLIAATIAIAAPQAFAQAKNFAGFNLGVGFESTKTTVTGINASAAAGSDSGTTSGATLHGGYNWALGQQFVLGAGLTLGSVENSSGTLGTTAITTKSRVSIEVLPGFAVSDTVLVYGKLASLGMSGVGANTATFSGLGVGIGARVMVDKNWYLQTSYDSNTYADGVDARFTSTAFSIGAGYKF